MKKPVSIVLCCALMAAGVAVAEEIESFEGVWLGYAVRIDGKVYAIDDIGMDMAIITPPPQSE